MPEATPPTAAPETPAAPPAPVKVVPEPKTREQLAADALGVLPDAPDPYDTEAPIAEPATEIPPTEAAPEEKTPEDRPPAPVKDFALIAAQRRAQAEARRRAPP